MIDEIISRIREYGTIIIHRHKSPDLDAVGSQAALKLSLLGSYPDKKIYAVGDMREDLMSFASMDDIPDDAYKDALVITTDTAAAHLISDERYKLAGYLLAIDHHLGREPYGDMTWADETACAACEMIARFILEKTLYLDGEIATLLMAGIITDSGRFLYENVSAGTFRITAALLAYGVDLPRLYERIYTEELAVRRLKGHYMSSFRVTPAGVAYMKMTMEDVKNSGVPTFTVSRGMAGTMSDVAGIHIWVNFTEDEEGIYTELRSRALPVNELAAKYGGGGHKLASGALLKSWAQADALIGDLDALIRAGHREPQG